MSTLTMPDGRTVGYEDLGAAGDHPIIWCHGGPGSRLEPTAASAGVAGMGIRIIGIDRPGYGLSDPLPGRSIGDWVDDGIAVADALDLDRFTVLGVSTGGAYALALAATHPHRVDGVIACCALTDMRWTEGRASMSGDMTVGIWDLEGDREAAIAIARANLGDDGSGLLSQAASGGPTDGTPGLAPSDLAVLADPAFLSGLVEGMAESMRQGVYGYVDDRIADGVGWGSFDVGAVEARTIVLHGGSDTIVPVVQARHTASIVDGAELRIHDDLGHFSIMGELAGAFAAILGS
jgi:pimeloyl-ACP methyl ester carboxylesterase